LSSSPKATPIWSGVPSPLSAVRLISPVFASTSAVKLTPSCSMWILPSAPTSTGIGFDSEPGTPVPLPPPGAAGVFPATGACVPGACGPPWVAVPVSWLAMAVTACVPFWPISALAASGFLLKSRS
jgi:hypothetical protein